MELLRSTLLPRRITQIYTDTKKCYEQIIQAQVTDPQLSFLNLKLRIQKDRLVAWGLEWADSNTAQHGDIDDSLDRAGVSDLVASIMSSIRELLDEAERLQPRPSVPIIPGSYPDQKGSILASPNHQWSPSELGRLGEIVKDITTSIDTLCDLSRSQQAMHQEASLGQDEKKSLNIRSDSKSLDPQSFLPREKGHEKSQSLPSLQGVSSVVTSSCIDPDRLGFPRSSTMQTSQPPSYETVATVPGNRVIAFLKTASRAQSPKMPPQYSEVPVFVDYGYEFDSNPGTGRLPSLTRYENLVLALQTSTADAEHTYTGCLRILGWFEDRFRSHFGFVYQIPQTPRLDMDTPNLAPSPRTLLSFLQKSGDTDSENMPRLEDRFRLALNLVSNILHTHAKGVTHRNINSNNIIFASKNITEAAGAKPWKEGVIRKPYLVSWDQCSEDAFVPEDEMLISSIYRYPNTIRGRRSTFRPAHDIYSLGIVLLEIGLWMPVHKLWKNKYVRSDFKARLQTIYAPKLAGKCGSSYMNVVEYCLCAADDYGTRDTAQQLHGQQADRQTEFYWNALKPLERCCMIDESSDPVLQPSPSASLANSEVLSTDTAVNAAVDDARSIMTQQIAETSPIPIPEERFKTDSPTQPGVQSDLLVWSYDIPKSTRSYFDTIMMPKLSRMLARAIDRWESYQIDIFMAGETPDLARPTILMVCRSITRAWKILEYVNKDRKMFDVRVAMGQIHYSKAAKKRRRPRKPASSASTTPQLISESSREPSQYQRKPACGASIGAFVDEQHLEAVTFGGVVLVDGQPFGMSVHHMLEDHDVDHGLDYVLDSEEPALTQSQTDSSIQSEYQTGWYPFQSDNTSPAPPNHSEIHQAQCLKDADFDPRILDQDYEDEDDECFNLGDTLGTMPGKGRELIVTQPALDDVDPSFFPSEEDMSDEHLSSHGLGYIHASSGIKQVKHDNISHEVDWVLFKVCEGRLAPQNSIAGGQKYCTAPPSQYPCRVLRATALGDLAVHAIGSKSGLAAGKISSNMVLTKMPGRVFPSPVWRFKGDFGVGGDSGAWVVDNDTGALCGHVTAWSDYHQNGTISPMEVLLSDMERTLGKPVALPSAIESSHSYKDQVVRGGEAVELPEPFKEQGAGLSCHRETSFHSDYGSDNEGETTDVEVRVDVVEGISPAVSPAIATSPSTPGAVKGIEGLSLDDVAEQWTRSQEQRRGMEGGKVRALEEGAGVSSHLEARC